MSSFELPDTEVLFEASPNAYVLFDKDLTIVKANEAFLEATGREREALLGQHVFEAFPGDPEDPDDPNVRRLKASFERVLSTGEPDSLAMIPYTIPRETDEGETTYEERYWSTTHTPIFDDSGEVAFILQHTTDVTDLYKTKEKLQDLQEKEGAHKKGDSSQQRGREEPQAPEPEAAESVEVPPGEDVSPEEGSAAREPAAKAPAETNGGGKSLTQQVEKGVLSRAEEVQKAYWASEEEREHLRRLFEQAPGFMVFQRGPDHVYEMANEAYFDLIGRRDIIGKTVREALPELEGQGFFELLDQVYETGEPYVGHEVEVQMHRGSDEELETVYCDFIYQPIIEPDGSVSGIFTQGHDVTEKKKAKDQLREQRDELKKLNETLEARAHEAHREQERLRSLLDSIPDEVWFCNEDREISLVNEAVAEKFGFESPEDARRPLKEVLLELDLYKPDGTPRPIEEDPLFRSLEGEVLEGEEELLILPETGEKRHRQVNSVPIHGPSGEVIGSVAVTRDITELKRTEKKLRKRERDFTTLANNIPQLAWMADPDGHIFWYNERWYEYTGTTFEEMEGWGWKKVHHPDHLGRVVQRYKKAIETEEPFEETFPMKGKDGEYRWFLTRAMPIRDEEGRVSRWFGTNTDITKRLELEEELKELNETLEERVEKRTRQVRKLTSHVTRAEQRERRRISRLLHDNLQQRLYGSQLQVQSLCGSLEENGQEELAGEAEAAASGIEEVIRAMRRLSVGMSPPVLEREGLTAALEWLKSHMEEIYGLEVELEAEREFQTQVEMRVLLFQTARELLSNVAKHAGVGEATARLFEEENNLVLEVEDEGEGFDPEQVDLEDPEGSFGLTAARERLRLFDGDLTARSAPGEGTRVTARLPLEKSLKGPQTGR